MTTDRAITPNPVLPSHYHSLVDTDTKLRCGHRLMELARDRGLDPVAATVTGSVLRGLDTPTSDIDAFVIVAGQRRRSRTWQDVTEPVSGVVMGDVQVISFETFRAKLCSSINFAEALHSPFLVLSDYWRAFFLAHRLPPYVLESSARGVVYNAARRGNRHPDKQHRQAVGSWYFLTTYSPLVPRSYLDPTNAPAEFHAWMSDTLSDLT